jgi:hypothetical protein
LIFQSFFHDNFSKRIHCYEKENCLYPLFSPSPVGWFHGGLLVIPGKPGGGHSTDHDDGGKTSGRRDTHTNHHDHDRKKIVRFEPDIQMRLLQNDCKCHSEQSEESFKVLILQVLLKISPDGRNDKNADSRIFVTGSNYRKIN